MRIAFSGASGTGKTTLATYVSERYGIPINPVGSRSVSRAMGFETPYDVDKVGRRAEFQRRLVDEKVGWEAQRDRFVTDRSTLDHLAYTILHDVHAIGEELLGDVVVGLARYTHVVYCPVSALCVIGDDPARVKDMTYQKLFDVVIDGLLRRYLPPSVETITLTTGNVDLRRLWIREFLSGQRY